MLGSCLVRLEIVIGDHYVVLRRISKLFNTD